MNGSCHDCHSFSHLRQCVWTRTCHIPCKFKFYHVRAIKSNIVVLQTVPWYKIKYDIRSSKSRVERHMINNMNSLFHKMFQLLETINTSWERLYVLAATHDFPLSRKARFYHLWCTRDEACVCVWRAQDQSVAFITGHHKTAWNTEPFQWKCA